MDATLTDSNIGSSIYLDQSELNPITLDQSELVPSSLVQSELAIESSDLSIETIKNSDNDLTMNTVISTDIEGCIFHACIFQVIYYVCILIDIAYGDA